MNMFQRAFSFMRRNLAFANSFISKVSRPIWTDWNTKKAIKEGYKANGWVYRAVTLAMKSVSQVPWAVVNIEDELAIEEHHLTKLLRHPNPHISRKEIFELWTSWLELSGNALSLKVKASGIETDAGPNKETVELWPISPERIRPVSSTVINEWIKGYAIDTSKGVDYEPDQILHFKYTDPGSPFWGMSPLQPASMVVDTDTDQKTWNKTAMQNMGVLSGMISFKKEFEDQDKTDAMSERVNERFGGGAKSGNARRLGVFGSEAKYQRIGATPQELDFGDSRKANMNEIFVIFGTSPIYAGSTEAMTYNNYQTSELVYWFQKVIPILDDLEDTFNFSFADELKEGEKITYFLNDVDAIRRAWLERAKVALTLYEMGVPFDRINKTFKFGIEEFEGWEKSYPGGKIWTQAQAQGEGAVVDPGGRNIDPEETRLDTTPLQTPESPFLSFEERDIEQEIEDREEWSQKWTAPIQNLLDEQMILINNAIDEHTDEFDRLTGAIDPQVILADTYKEDWEPVYFDLTRGYALKAAGQIVIEKRQDDLFVETLEEYLESERIVLNELALIEKSTANAIIIQVENALEEGLTGSQLQQAIIDAGIFEPPPDIKVGVGIRGRALRLSRTITGTAGSMGQFVGARETGATHKKWRDSGFEVRDEHVERNAELAVGINGRFSPKFGAVTGPRYPLDPQMPVGDRVNCRCSMSFEIRDEPTI